MYSLNLNTFFLSKRIYKACLVFYIYDLTLYIYIYIYVYMHTHVNLHTHIYMKIV